VLVARMQWKRKSKRDLRDLILNKVCDIGSAIVAGR
jgi:hypothetical protein